MLGVAHQLEQLRAYRGIKAVERAFRDVIVERPEDQDGLLGQELAQHSPHQGRW